MRFASRKLWVCLILLALSTALLMVGKIGEASWLSIAGTIAWAYITGNVGQTAASSLADVLAAMKK